MDARCHERQSVPSVIEAVGVLVVPGADPQVVEYSTLGWGAGSWLSKDFQKVSGEALGFGSGLDNRFGWLGFFGIAHAALPFPPIT